VYWQWQQYTTWSKAWPWQQQPMVNWVLQGLLLLLQRQLAAPQPLC
jgi:hypothetical protein